MALTKITGQVINTATDVTVGVLTVTNTLAVGGTVSIGGTLTYEDVTNVDAVGLITARNGIVVGSGITLSKDGDIFATGVTTSTSFTGTLNTAAQPNVTSLGTLTSLDVSGGLGIAESLFHIGDTNTRVAFTAADTITLDTAGSERLRIDSDGNLIHTSTNKTLSLVSTQNQSAAGTKIAFFGANRYDTDEEFAAIKGLLVSNSGGSGAKQNGKLQFIVGSGSTAHTMSHGGLVGINTDTPRSRLHVHTARSGFDYGSTGQLIVENNNNSIIQILAPSTEYSAVHFGDEDNGMVGRIQYAHDQNSMRFWTQNNERVTIMGNGRLGIGTTSATKLLHINTTAQNTEGILLETKDNNYNQIIFDANRSGSDQAIGQIAGYWNGTSIGEIRFESGADTTNKDEGLITFFVTDAGTKSQQMRLTSNGQLLIGGHGSPENAGYKIDIQADTTTHYHGLSVRASTLQNDTFCVAALAHVTPSGSATQRRAHIGCYRNGSSQPGGYVYMSQSDGGNTYLWPDSTNTLRISNSLSNVTTDNGSVVGGQTSDIRLKKVHGDITYGLAEINKINPIEFNFKNDKNVQKRIGFSAQDLQSIIPESVYNTKNTEEVDGVEIEDILGMEYVQITPVLVNAVKELSTEIDNLKAEIAALKSS